MSKWETQGRINLKMPSVEEHYLYLEIRFLRLPFCYITASPCLPVEGEAAKERKSFGCLSSNLSSSMMVDGCWQVPTGVSSSLTWENQTSPSEEPRASVTRNSAGPCRGCLPSSLHWVDGETSSFGQRLFICYTKHTMTKSLHFLMF